MPEEADCLFKVVEKGFVVEQVGTDDMKLVG
jgi:hypothetical protein